jgi:hypothetical protein
MDKPINLSIKAFLIRKLSTDILIPEHIVELVISHQFTTALNALSDANIKSVEISGFGVFKFHERKAVWTMEKYLKFEKTLEDRINDESLSERKRKSSALMLATLRTNIELLKPRLNNEH